MTQKERVIRRERWSRHFPEEKKRKRKIKNPPPLPFFFGFFGGVKEEEEEVSFDFFFGACDKMIRVISKTFCRTEEEAWKSAFWGDPNSPTDDFNERRGKKNTRRRRTKSGGFFVYAADDFTFFSLLPRETERHRP